MKKIFNYVPGCPGNLEINGVQMEAQNVAEHNGRVRYSLYYRGDSSGEYKAVWPSFRKMQALSKKFLKCEYRESKEDYLKRGHFLFFEIDSGLPQEDRAAFLSAVCVHIKLEFKHTFA